MKSSAAVSFNKAKENYIRALELNNKDIYVHGILGFIYGDNKEYDKAEKLFYSSDYESVLVLTKK